MSITSSRGDAMVDVEVANAGPVLAETDVARLAEPFHRGDRTRLEGDGLGLGLSPVDSVARAHGGTLDLRPRAGGGLHARLELELPRTG